MLAADLQKVMMSSDPIGSEESVLDEPLRLASTSLASLRLESSGSQLLANHVRGERGGLAAPLGASNASQEQHHHHHYLRTRSFDEMSLHNMATGLSLGRTAGGAGPGRSAENESPGEAGLQLVDFDDAASEAQSTVDSEFPGTAAGSKWPSSLTQQPLYVRVQRIRVLLYTQPLKLLVVVLC